MKRQRSNKIPWRKNAKVIIHSKNVIVLLHIMSWKQFFIFIKTRRWSGTPLARRHEQGLCFSACQEFYHLYLLCIMLYYIQLLHTYIRTFISQMLIEHRLTCVGPCFRQSGFFYINFKFCVRNKVCFSNIFAYSFSRTNIFYSVYCSEI